MNEKERVSFINEVGVLKKLDHPNVVKVYEFFVEARYYHIVTEL
jgi:calcium-dependent protein kinase